LSNAIKFTNKGIVELGLRMESKHLEFYVKDTGIGIQENDIETIFERFRKSTDDKNTLYRGVGLGLAISKALALLLGGNLTVESVFGKRSVFTLQLPDTVISNDVSVELKIPVISDTHSYSKKNILVVEDELANFMYVNKMLAKSNLRVFRAENGLEALEILKSGKNFHLILMDIKMPGLDGFEATKIIKSKNPDQIVIAVTAYARPEERLRFMEAGFNDYITKPIKPDEFRSILRKFIL
jgi:CheY-like chemotaxis protein